MVIRLFDTIGLDVSSLFVDDNEEVLESDVRMFHIRSLSFSRAQRIANERMFRMDEMSAVLDRAISEKGMKVYKSLREEIVGTYAIEFSNGESAKIPRKEKVKRNKKAVAGISNFLGR